MLRPKHWLAIVVLAAVSFPAFRLQAGDAVKLVPADALATVVIDGVDSLEAKMGKVRESLQLPLPGPLAALQGVPGLSDCLDMESAIVVAVFPGPESSDKPVPVAYVPVKDFGAFTKLFGGEAAGDFVRLTVPTVPVLAAEKDGFALIVADGEEPTLGRALVSAGGMAERLGDDLAWIEKRDVAVAVSDGGISWGCQKLLEGIEAAQQGIRMQGKDEIGAADILNIYKRFFALVDQEMELLAVGLDVQESGDLVLHVRKRFLPDGQLARCLGMPAAPADLLAGLPAEPFIFAGGGQLTPAMGELMMEYSVEVMKAAPNLYGIGEEDARQMMQSAAPILEDMRSLAMMLAVGSSEDTIYSRMAAVMKCKDSAKYMGAYEKYIREFGDLMKGSKGIFPMSMETSPIEIDGCKGVEIAMEFPKQMLAGEPAAEAMIEKMIGPDGKVRVFVVAADEHTILLGYTNKNLLLKALAATRSGESLSRQESVQQAAAMLGEGNLARGYFNPAGLVSFVNDMIETVAPEGAKVRLPAFPETPPVAWAAHAEGAAVDAQLVVPGVMIKAGVGYAAQLRQAFQADKE